jgi:hypothetical protein
MAEPRQKNAIERRIDLLRAQWSGFAARRDARLLVWLVDEGEARVIEGFLAVESDDRTGELLHLFLRLDVAFADGAAYGHELRRAIAAQYEQSRAGLAEAGIEAGWTPPREAAGGSDADALVACCASLAEHHGIARLCLALFPDAVDDRPAFRRWLRGAAAQAAPFEAVRLLVLEERGDPDAAALEGEAHGAVVAIAADLDMPSAYEELAMGDGASDTPGDAFRRSYMRMLLASGRGDREAASALADEALGVARREGWHAQAAAVHFAMGSALLGDGRHPEAVLRFREADAAAAESEQRGDPAGTKLRVHARLAIGAALVAAGAHEEAAGVYREAAPLAQAAGDDVLFIECWRMAGASHAEARRPDLAWTAGLEAVRVGAAMPPEARAATTLRYVGRDLLALAGRREHAADARVIEDQMAKLLGPGWHPDAQPGGGS